MTNNGLVLNVCWSFRYWNQSQWKTSGLDKSRDVAKRDGSIADNARKDLEKQLGKKVISKSNPKNPELLDELSLKLILTLIFICIL